MQLILEKIHPLTKISLSLHLPDYININFDQYLFHSLYLTMQMIRTTHSYYL